MQVLNRNPGSGITLHLEDGTEILIVNKGTSNARFGIQAPKNVLIRRNEVPKSEALARRKDKMGS